MTLVLISSTQDIASTNIKKGLLDLADWEEIDMFFHHPVYNFEGKKDVVLITINDKKITHEHLEQEIKQHVNITPSKAIFLSRHRSKSGEPTLTTHPIGNYHEALFGGLEKTLCTALPQMMTDLLRTMSIVATRENLYHQVGFEVTHHGPYMSIPTMFAEVGSTLEEWKKQRPALAVAESILTLLSKYNDERNVSENIPVLVGIGGGHYAPRFTKVALQKKVAFGHMIPSYHIKPDHIDQGMLKKAIDATPEASGVYLSRKALKKSTKSKIKQWCEHLDIPIVSSKDFNDL